LGRFFVFGGFFERWPALIYPWNTLRVLPGGPCEVVSGL
jgi:hypothetical protein